MKRYLIILFTLIFFIKIGVAGSFDNMVNMDLSARGMSLGGSSVAIIDNIYGIEINPASLYLLTHKYFSASYANWYSDINLISFHYAFKKAKNGIGFGYTRLFSTPENETDIYGNLTGRKLSFGFNLITLSYATSLLYFPAGISIKMLNIDMGDRSSTSFLMNFSIMYQMNILKLYKSNEKNFTLAFALRNINKGLRLGNEIDFLPLQLSGGVFYNIYKKEFFSLSALYEIDYSLNGVFQSAIGAEVGIKKLIYIRAGASLFESSLNFSGGIGVKLNKDLHFMNIDYGIRLNNNLGFQHFVQITYFR